MSEAIDALRDGAEVVRESGGILSSIGSILTAPFRAIGGAISGFFGGIFSGTMWIGLPLVGLAHFAPSLLENIRDRIGNAHVSNVINHILSGDWTERLTWAGLTGAGVGGGLNGIMQAVSSVFGGSESSRGEREESGGIGMIGGLAMTAAVIGIGAVLVDHVQNNGDATAPSRPPVPPRPPGGQQLPPGTTH